MSSKNAARIVLNTFLGVILIFVWSHFVNISQLIDTIKTINPLFLIFYFLFFALATLFRTARLKFLLDFYPFEFKNLLFLNFISQLLSFTIPIRAGEIAKGAYLSTDQKSKIPFLKALLWVFVDRFLDFWVYIIIVGILIFLIPNNLPEKARILAVILVLVFTTLALLMVFANSLSQKLIHFGSKFLVFPKLKKGFTNFALGIAQAFVILERPMGGILRLFSLSVLAVGSDLLLFLVVYLSFDSHINVSRVLLGSGLTVFTFLIPAAPGYVGSVEASNLAIFGGIVGFSANLASSAAVVLHILSLLAILIFGIPSLYLLKFNLNQVWSKLKRS